MSFVTAVKTCLRKYADFTGRARRSEYWWFYLAYVLAVLAVAIVGGVLTAVAGAVSESASGVVGTLVGLVYGLVALGLVLPTLAVGARRLHDTGRSGWWLLIGLIPLGGIVLLVFWVTDSTPGTNRFGPSPKDLAAQAGPAGTGYGAPTQGYGSSV